MIKVDNYVIDTPLIDILNALREEVNGDKLDLIQDKSEQVKVTCPFHADGHEHRPSCYIRKDDGVFHCFTDGESGKLEKFVSGVLDCSIEKAKKWIISNYGNIYQKPKYKLDDIVLPNQQKETLDEAILDTFDPYHPYMTQRKISDEVIKEFELRFDPKTKCIVFPVRDKYGRLVFLTKRSILSKKFYIDEKKKKEVYLLYNILKNNYKQVYICESQINALVCRSYGKPAVAMFGAACPDNQIKDLNNTQVLNYVICFDPDEGGLKGIIRLCDNLKNKFISVMVLPKGKDVGDLTKEEFDSCPILDKDEFLQKIPDYYLD